MGQGRLRGPGGGPVSGSVNDGPDDQPSVAL